MTKSITGVVVIGVLVLSAIAWKSYVFEGTVQYIQGEKEVVEKEVTISELEKRISDAISASSTAIETEASKAYEEKKTQMQKEVELQVTRAYKAEIEARETKLEEEVSF